MGPIKAFLGRQFKFLNPKSLFGNRFEPDDDLYPGVFGCSERESRKAQKNHFALMGIYYFSLLFASGVAGIAGDNKTILAVSGFLIVVSIIISVHMRYSLLEDHWYRCRALAESIKTSVWHFVMCSEPYDESYEKSEQELRSRIVDLLAEHGDRIPSKLSVADTSVIVTRHMGNVRSMPWPEKLDYYVEKRVEDQLRWYSMKATKNEEAAQIWFERLIACQLFACAFVMLRVPFPSTSWLIGLALIGAGAISAWAQAKKFNELSSAYTVTVADIKDLKEEAKDVGSATELAKYAGDSENAFSREHAQWLARKD